MGAKGGNSKVQFFPGQKNAIGGSVFNEGGIFDQFLQGKPNAGFERAQGNAFQQLQRTQAQSGMTGQPLAARQQNDFLQQSTQASGDNFMSTLFNFMQPAGSQSAGGTPGFVNQLMGKG